MSEIQRVGVVGAGLMGTGIAEVCARAGLDVLIADAEPSALQQGKDRIAASLARAIRSGKLTEQDCSAAEARLSYTLELPEFRDRDMVVEAVAESESAKTNVLATLDKVLDQNDAIVASNTSSIPIIRLAMATSRPEHVIGIHFFNPAQVLPLVELVPSMLTNPATKDRAERFATNLLGKDVIVCQDRAGFVVNALLVPYLLSAIRMVDSGRAQVDDVDKAMKLGCAHPMGPLQLADLIGLDTTMAIAESMYQQSKEAHHFPPPLLQQMVSAGRTGKKSGQGFYDYTGDSALPAVKP